MRKGATYPRTVNLVCVAQGVPANRRQCMCMYSLPEEDFCILRENVQVICPTAQK